MVTAERVDLSAAPLPDLSAMRALVRETQAVTEYLPSGGGWAAAEARLWPTGVVA